MDQKARKIFIAVALGTMLGLSSSVTFLPELVWWFGALIGGMSAGFIYGLPDVVRFAPDAFRVAKKDLKKTKETFSAVAKTIREMPAYEKWGWLVHITFFIIFLAWTCFLFLTGTELLFFEIGMLILLFYILPSMAIDLWSSFFSESRANETEKIKRAKKAIFFITPPGFLLLLILGLVKFGPKAIKSIVCFLFAISVELGCFLITFAKTLFLFVHSKELVLCAIDAAFAVLIAYPLLLATGNLQLGPGLLFAGLFGGLLGVLHYEIVSVRMLHVSR